MLKRVVFLVPIICILTSFPPYAHANGLANCLTIGTNDVNGSETIQFGQPYDIQIDNTCGRDIWGFSSTLTIYGPKNQSYQDAYYNLTYGPAHNYAHFVLGALPRGTYSATLQVNIQEDNSTVTLSVDGFNIKSAPTVPKRNFKETITCTNGKAMKKVSGYSPKCPLGYKLKK